MSPEYFKKYLTFTEAVLYVEGLNDRARTSWEQSRMIMNVINSSMGGDGINLPLPWEQEGEERPATNEMTDDEKRQLLEEANIINEQIKNGEI